MKSTPTILSRLRKFVPERETKYSIEEGFFRSWILFDGSKLVQVNGTIAPMVVDMLNGAYMYGRLKGYSEVKDFVERLLK